MMKLLCLMSVLLLQSYAWSERNDDALRALLQEYAEGDDIMLVTATQSYAEVTYNWIYRLRSTPYAGNYLVLGLDDGLCATLRRLDADRRQGIVCEQLSHPAFGESQKVGDGNLSKVWQSRTRTIAKLLRLGFNVLHSDVDAIWLKPPFGPGHPVTGTGHDIVFSRGGFPQRVASAWGGFAGVMGLVYFRAVPHVAELLDVTSKQADDQQGINEALMKWKMAWQEYTPILGAYEGVATALGDETFSVLNVPHEIVLRYCGNDELRESVVVAHCLVPKSGDGKMQAFRNMHLHMDDVVQRPRTDKHLEADKVLTLAPQRIAEARATVDLSRHDIVARIRARQLITFAKNAEAKQKQGSAVERLLARHRQRKQQVSRS
jgi:Nucleotide-diphospho-sugar transferase